jgi:lipoate-protein ligase B
VWHAGRKLASIGVHARDWVTWHGVALNVENDLSTFDHVVPCGIDQVTMTTVARECTSTGIPTRDMRTISDAVVQGFANTFCVDAVPIPDSMREILAVPASGTATAGRG